MTITLTLRASQGADGAPIQAAIQFVSNDPDGDSYPYWFLGVSTTATPPATRAGFAAVERVERHTANADQGAAQSQYSWSGGVETSGRETQSASAIKRLDATYVAGRYLWAVAFDNNPPGSGDAPTHLSGPYLIR